MNSLLLKQFHIPSSRCCSFEGTFDGPTSAFGRVAFSRGHSKASAGAALTDFFGGSLCATQLSGLHGQLKEGQQLWA